jgi:hypothetical protein
LKQTRLVDVIIVGLDALPKSRGPIFLDNNRFTAQSK